MASRPLRSLAGKPKGLSRGADEGAERLAVLGRTSAMVMTSSTMPGSSRPVFEPSTCMAKYGLPKSSSRLSRMPTSQTFLPRRVLQVGQPADHLLAEQPVGAAQVRLAAAVRGRLRLALAPLQADAGGDGDRVDEDRLVPVEHARVAEGGADAARSAPGRRAGRRASPGSGRRSSRRGRGRSSQSRMRTSSPGQPWTASSPASRFRNSVRAASSVQSWLVLPMPEMPVSTPLMPRGSASRWSAVMIRSPAVTGAAIRSTSSGSGGRSAIRAWRRPHPRPAPDRAAASGRRAGPRSG